MEGVKQAQEYQLETHQVPKIQQVQQTQQHQVTQPGVLVVHNPSIAKVNLGSHDVYSPTLESLRFMSQHSWEAELPQDESTSTPLTAEESFQKQQSDRQPLLRRAASCPNLLSLIPEGSSSLIHYGLQIEVDGIKKGVDYYLHKSLKSVYIPLKEDKFYIIANQLYRLNKFTFACPLCQKVKGKVDINGKGTCHPRSHLFPRTLFENFLKIHSSKVAYDHYHGQLIYDAFAEKFKTAKTVTYPIFCYVCENKASEREKFSKDLYLQIMAGEDDKYLRITKKQRKDIEYILALLLFRGILFAVDFLKLVCEPYFPKFMNIFLKLRKFCDETLDSSWDKSFARRILVFILPNGHFNLENPNYSLDFQLRNPLYTTIVVPKDSTSIFLYTKFDCFHCVLPLDTNHNFRSEHSCFQPSNDNETYYLHYGRKGIKPLFPKILLDYNIEAMGHLVQILTGLDRPCHIILKGLESAVQCDEDKKSDQSISEHVDVKCLDNKRDIEDCIERARERSPLVNLGMVGNELKKLLDQSEMKGKQHSSQKQQELEDENSELRRNQERLLEYIGELEKSRTFKEFDKERTVADISPQSPSDADYYL